MESVSAQSQGPVSSSCNPVGVTKSQAETHTMRKLHDYLRPWGGSGRSLQGTDTPASWALGQEQP